jgi:hypothetical protein
VSRCGWWCISSNSSCWIVVLGIEW